MKRIFATLLAAMAVGICAASPVRSDIGAEGKEYAHDDWEPTASDYIQDGLYVLFDSIENLGWGVSNPDATQWVDLVSGMTFTCTFKEGGGAIFSANKQNSLLGLSAYPTTVEVVVQRIPIEGTRQNHSVAVSRYHYRDGVLTAGFISAERSPVNTKQYIKVPAGNYQFQGITPEDVHVLAATFDMVDGVPVGQYYLDGIKVDEKESTVQFEFYEARTYYNFHPNNVIYRFSHYGRVLSDTELRWNYLIDKWRFGL